ncbi:MAG TPA: site-specific integrase [Gemmatimonadaceae bacterium]
MPPIPSRDAIVEYTKADGSILRATLELRAEGTYAINLRKWDLGRPTLKPVGQRFGTKNLKEARELARLELGKIAGGEPSGTAEAARGPLGHVKAYVDNSVRDGKIRPTGSAAAYRCISRCWLILRDRVGLTQWSQFDREHVEPLCDALYELEHRGKPLGRNSVLKHLNYLKGFTRNARDKGLMSSLPVHQHTSVPKRDKSYKRAWMEPAEMGLLLERSFALRDVESAYPHNACQDWPEILATECYTGAREDEILGLATEDVTLKGGRYGYGTMTFRDNKFRELKNPGSERTFHIWPALGRILRVYEKRKRPVKGGLFFARPDGRMWAELRESMARDLKAAGIEKHITDHSMRHGYISARARMYTEFVEHGRTIQRAVHWADIKNEVGHASVAMRAVYEHDSQHPVEGWTELDYAAALTRAREEENEAKLRRSGRRTKAVTSKPPAAKAGPRKAGPAKAAPRKAAPRKRQAAGR